MKTVQYWPIGVAVLISICNIDFLIIPWLKTINLSPLNIFVLVSLLGSIELSYWYWFWGWFIKIVEYSQLVRESIEFSKEIAVDLKKQGFIDRVINYYAKRFNGATNKTSRLMKWVHRGGYVSAFVIGLIPEPGIRIAGVIFCKSIQWRTGFVALMAGNIFHIGYIVGGWHFIFSIFKN